MRENYKRLFDEGIAHVRIKWSKPFPLNDDWSVLSKIDQSHIFLYKIIATRGDNHKLLYIGMSEKQAIEKRLSQKDHLTKQQQMREANKGWRLQYCLGTYVYHTQNGVDVPWALKNIRLLEKLLIITHSDIATLTNKVGVNWFSTGAWVRIYNSGFLKDGMKKEVAYGLFYR